MFKTGFRKPGITLPDLLAIGLILGSISALYFIGQYWAGPIEAPEPIDLSLRSLPYATFLSIGRIVIAFVVCLISSIIVGYWAAHSRVAEKILVPLIDIGQSIPVLGFLPGLVLTFLSLFPNSRVGLEIACVLTLYTSMAWNLMLSFYASVKTIPRDYVEVIRSYGYGPLGRLLRLEFPYATNGLIWNSMLSVAGGWFFLTVCESYSLGNRSFRLVGLGSYMALAAEKNDVVAIAAGVVVMVLILIATDYFIWRPLLRWAERFQRADFSEEDESDDVISFFSKSKWLTGILRKLRRRYALRLYVNRRIRRKGPEFPVLVAILPWVIFAFGAAISVWACFRAVHLMTGIPHKEWFQLLRDTGWTLLRVTAALFLSSLLMIPLGLWMGTNATLIKRMQSIMQIVAAFPAPMIFPVLIGMFLFLSIPFSVGSVILMMTGAQWYLLFNVISGAAMVPRNLVEVAQMSGMSNVGIMYRVFLPATFPQILTGLITAAGGAWNTSIVAELVTFRGQEFRAPGLGAYLADAAYNAHYPELIAAISVMVIVIVLLNRLFWAKLYDLAESRYRLDV